MSYLNPSFMVQPMAIVLKWMLRFFSFVGTEPVITMSQRYLVAIAGLNCQSSLIFFYRCMYLITEEMVVISGFWGEIFSFLSLSVLASVSMGHCLIQGPLFKQGLYLANSHGTM